MSGCSSIGPCSYDLQSNGWSPTDLRPEGLPTHHYQSPGWFVDEEGRLLICRKLDAKNFCGGIYHVYRKAENGYVEEAEIVCIT